MIAALVSTGDRAFAPPHHANAMLLCEHLQWSGAGDTVPVEQLFSRGCYYLQYEEQWSLWQLQPVMTAYLDDTGVPSRPSLDQS